MVSDDFQSSQIIGHWLPYLSAVSRISEPGDPTPNVVDLPSTKLARFQATFLLLECALLNEYYAQGAQGIYDIAKLAMSHTDAYINNRAFFGKCTAIT